MLKLNFTTNSLIMPISTELTRIGSIQYYQCMVNYINKNEIKVISDEELIINDTTYVLVEINDWCYFLLYYLIDENNSCIFEDFIINYPNLTEEAKANFLKNIKNINLKNEFVLNLNNGNSVSFFLDEFCTEQKPYLAMLDNYIKQNIKKQQTSVVAKLLEYRNINYSKKEIDSYNENKHAKELGFIPISQEDLTTNWTYTKENDEITLEGYKGDLRKVLIPLELDNGTKIVKIQDYTLYRKEPEFLHNKISVDEAGDEEKLGFSISKFLYDFMSKPKNNTDIMTYVSEYHKPYYSNNSGIIDPEFDYILSLFDK